MSGKPIPSSEISRRNKIRSIPAYVELYVNGHKVETSRTSKVSWPSFEADFGDLFTLFLFTMPKSIEIRLRIQGSEICRIPVEIPGTKVEALTSAYALMKEIRFSKNDYKEQLKQKKIKENEEGKEILVKDEPLVVTKIDKKKDQAAPGAVNQPQAPAATVPPAAQKPNAEIKEEKLAEKPKTKSYYGPDINGYIYFKSEWKGEGSEMPPLIQLLLWKESKENPVEDKAIEKSKIIDLNDPRYYWVVRNYKENNKKLQEMIKRDSLIPLHDLQPFRHIQLINQEIHYELLNIDIPILEQEVVKDPVLSFYIEKYSKLTAQNTYDKMKKEVGSYSGTERLQDMSEEVLARRQIFLEKVKRVLRDIKIGKNKPNINYHSVVREVGGIDTKNPCAGLIGKIFEPRRKLRPKIKDKISVSIASVSEAIIKVHIVSGINIPIRSESLQAIEKLNQQFSGKGNNMPGFRQDNPGQSDYGRNQYPYPQNNNMRDPYNRNSDQYDRTLGRPRGPYPDDSSNYGYPPRGAATDYRGGRDFRETGRDQFGRNEGDMRDGYTTGYQDRLRNDRLGASQMYPGGLDRGAPQYSGYGTVSNPYGTMGGRGPLSAFGANLRGDQAQGFRNQMPGDNMSLINRTKMELTGITKLIKGSIFIEVRLSNERTGEDTVQIKRTREATGSFPDWNETLAFKLFSKNGKAFTEEELIKGNDTLYFSLFDKYETERYIPSTNKYEITVENKFLGSFSIKLISILQNFPKMEGQIRINRPLNLQGYGMLPSGMLSTNIFNKDIDTELLPSYISLSINLDPLLELPAENEYDFYPGGEDSKLLRAGALWSNSHRVVPKGAPLVVKMFGENVERKSILICRYLTPQAPPKELLDLEHGPEREINFAIQTIARFVSLIPFIEDNSSFEEMPDMWCTSQEFIDFNGGDYEEHAILLCNYFNYIDGILNKDTVKSYIVLGSAVPEGYTTYVLRRNIKTNHAEIWDAVRGFAYFFGNKLEVSKC